MPRSAAGSGNGPGITAALQRIASANAGSSALLETCDRLRALRVVIEAANGTFTARAGNGRDIVLPKPLN
jgi:hypothetical protein